MAANHTRAWNATYETLPPSSGENASLGADRIRQVKLDVRERMVVDHTWADENSTDSDDGEHTKVTLKARSAPSPLADRVILYGFDYDNATDIRCEVYIRDESGNAIRLTDRGLLALLRSRNSWLRGQVTPEVVLTDAATVAVDASLSNAFILTPAANRALGVPTNGIAGQTVSIRVKQDNTGGRTLTYTGYKGSTADDLTLSAGANKEDLLILYCAGVNDWRIISLKKDCANAL